MPTPKLTWAALVLGSLFMAGCCLQAAAATSPIAGSSAAAHDGSHDFDFELGYWHIHLKKLLHPLSGAHDWVEYDGTTRTRSLWGGGAEIEEFNVKGSNGAIQGLTLRVYNPQSGQWSLYWSTPRIGQIGGPPNVGEFKNGVGYFYCWDTYNGRYVLQRFEWSRVNTDTPHFEQSFSDDGGKTWEVNWITDQTRIAKVPNGMQ